LPKTERRPPLGCVESAAAPPIRKKNPVDDVQKSSSGVIAPQAQPHLVNSVDCPQVRHPLAFKKRDDFPRAIVSAEVKAAKGAFHGCARITCVRGLLMKRSSVAPVPPPESRPFIALDSFFVICRSPALAGGARMICARLWPKAMSLPLVCGKGTGRHCETLVCLTRPSAAALTTGTWYKTPSAPHRNYEGKRQRESSKDHAMFLLQTCRIADPATESTSSGRAERSFEKPVVGLFQAARLRIQSKYQYPGNARGVRRSSGERPFPIKAMNDNHRRAHAK